MSEETRIDRLDDRLEGISIDTRVRIANLEATTDRIEKSVDKIVSEVSSLKSEFFKLGERLAWRMIIAFAVG